MSQVQQPIEVRPVPPGKFGVFRADEKLATFDSRDEAEGKAERLRAAPDEVRNKPKGADPLVAVANHESVVSVTMEDFYEGEETGPDDAIHAALPKEININGAMQRVVYFKWSPRFAATIEPLFRYARPVVKADFGRKLLDSQFSRGGGEYTSGFKEEPGCLYMTSLPGEDPLQYFWVPERIVAAQRKRELNRFEFGLTDQARGRQEVSEDRSRPNAQTGVNIDPLRTSTRELKIS
jgi:hypothetical protein